MSTATRLGLDERRRALAAIVDGIEREMRRLDLWEHTPPVPSRLSSTEPFCIDTLCFHEWLQWCFLPRMRRIFARGEVLPDASAIHPYACDCLAGCAHDPEKLLFLIQAFDELICSAGGKRSASSPRH